jgi:endonuclease/exonuclease/phosphatase family metal-dependent hydrolase
MPIKIITWNMDWWKRTDEQRKAGWEYLLKQDFDFALLQEVRPNLASAPGYNILFHKLPVKQGWGSAILTKCNGFINHVSNSREPSLMCYEFLLPSGNHIVIINMYGNLMNDGFGTTSVHNMISDITPVAAYGSQRYILIGGDLNVSEQWDAKYDDPAHKLCFDRLEDMNFINVTKEKFCGHIQTHVHPKSSEPWQNDYIFLNKTLWNKYLDCQVHNQDGMLDLSDHYPVEVTIDL